MENILSGISGPRKLADRVYIMIQEAIVNQELKPGEEITELSLAAKLGTSATPIREAISRLISDGLIVKPPNKAPRVVELGINEILNLYDIRCSLETLALTTAMSKVTSEDIKSLNDLQMQVENAYSAKQIEKYKEFNRRFHAMILELAENELLTTVMRTIMYKSALCVSSTVKIPGMQEYSINYHRQLIKLLQEKDKNKARNLLEKHFQKLKSEALNNLKDEII